MTGAPMMKQIHRGMIALMAITNLLVCASTPLGAEQSLQARALPIRKLSYKDVRQGLFALSKIQTAAIVMLGDSLTEGGPWRELTGCPSIVNRGIGGDTTKDVLGRLDGVFKLQPRAVFVMIGVNDISLGVRKEVTTQNFQALLDTFESNGTRTFLSYVLPVTGTYRKRRMNEEISALNVVISGLLAGRSNVTPIDLRPLVRDAGGYLGKEFSYDGLHLSPKGYEVWRDAIAPGIAEFCAP
jgi:lysophospholipase L1-like esterase